MSLQPPVPGGVLPPPPQAPPPLSSPVSAWPPGSTRPLQPWRPAGTTPRGVLVLLLTTATALAVLVRVYASVQGVERLVPAGVPLSKGAGRFLLLALLLVVAAVLAAVRDDLAGLAGGMAGATSAVFGSWMFQPPTAGFRAVTFLGLAAVGTALLAWALGALWGPAGPAARVPVGVTVAGIAVAGVVFLGQFLPVHRLVLGAEQTTVALLFAGFAVARRTGLWAAVGVAVVRLLFPVWYALVSPGRNPFDNTTHPVAFAGYVLVLLVAVVGLTSSASRVSRPAVPPPGVG